jgi:hypothetical protein
LCRRMRWLMTGESSAGLCAQQQEAGGAFIEP